MRRFAITLIVLLLVPLLAMAVTPERGKGISIHMLPKRVADLGKMRWGFIVSYAKYLKPEPAQPVLQSTEELLRYVRKQTQTVQENGVWIVTTNPRAYSNEEMRLLDDVKTLCRREHIPLFIARGSELPDGWRRYDNGP